MSVESTQEHLVLGASGAQGSAIIRELLTRKARVRGMVRSSAGITPKEAQCVVADLADVDALLTAFKGITHLTVTLPLIYDSIVIDTYAHNIASAARKTGIQRIVFNMNTRIPLEHTNVSAFNTRSSAEKILRSSDVPLVCIQPAVYLENLLAPTVIAGMKEFGQLHYPLPENMQVAWISHADLACSIANAHETPKIPETPILVGGKPVTGSELAEQLSEAIGHSLSYVPLDPAIFEKSIAAFLGSDAAAGVAGLYHWAFANPHSLLFATDRNGHDNLPAVSLVDAMTPRQWALQKFSINNV